MVFNKAVNFVLWKKKDFCFLFNPKSYKLIQRHTKRLSIVIDVNLDNNMKNKLHLTSRNIHLL